MAGKRHRLAGAPRSRETWAVALVKFWELTCTPVKDIVRGVMWERLAHQQWLEYPSGAFATMYPDGGTPNKESFWHRRFLRDFTTEQVEKRLDEAGVSREMMALFTPMPPEPDHYQAR